MHVCAHACTFTVYSDAMFLSIIIYTPTHTCAFYSYVYGVLYRFREGDDADFQDIPSLREHREKLLKEGRLNEGEKTKFTTFMKHAFDDLKTDAVDGFLDLKDNALGLVQKVQHVVETGSLSTPTRRPTGGAGGGGGSTSGVGGVSGRSAAWGEEDLEGGGGQEESHALFFKRHKIKVSPNVLAEQQLEHEAMALLPTPGAYSRLSPIDEREDEEESKSHRAAVINPLLKASSSSSSSVTTTTPAKPTLQRESSAESLIFGSSTGSGSGGTVQTGVGSGGASSSVPVQGAHDEATAADTSSSSTADKDKKL